MARQSSTLRGHGARGIAAIMKPGVAADQTDSSGGEPLVSELQEYHRQFAAIERDAELLLQGLTEPQLRWRENARMWSVADCLNHLVVAGNQSLANIRRAMADARSRGLLGRGPFRHGVLGSWLIRLMDAPPTIKFKSPEAYRPARDASVSEIVAEFFVLQHEMVRALKEANGLDLASVKVSNPVSRWFKMSLGQEFALTATHERRHLWQASRLRERLFLGRCRTERTHPWLLMSGLLLVGVAKRLKDGTATGVDIWQSEDLSGNRADVPLTLRQLKASGIE
jgi:hypothetical protein